MIIRSRMRKRMMRKKINPLSIGVSRLLLLKETEELEQPHEAKNSWHHMTQKALYDKVDD